MAAAKKPKASEFKPAGIRLIATVSKTVEDPEPAMKEATAARLARAKYDQALTSDDPVVVSAMLKDIEDDGTAGAALLKAALLVLQAKKRGEKLLAGKAHRRDVDYERYCKIADELRARSPDLKRHTHHYLAKKVQKELEKRGEKVVSTKTIERAFSRKNYC